MKQFRRFCCFCIVVSTVLIGYAQGSFGFSDSNDKVLLRDLQTITLYNGRMTTGRRSSPVPQVKCVGGSAYSSGFVPEVVQCYNRGSDGYDVQWECKADMDNAYRFGKVEVTCEGYDYPDDPYILRGSCGLEYTLELTEEGRQRQNQGGYQGYQKPHHHHDSYQSNQHSNSYSSKKHGSSWFGDILFLGGAAVVIYVIYKTCIATPAPDQGAGRTGGPYPSAPPPPYSNDPPPAYGFRDDYMPDSGCGQRTQGTSYTSGFTPGTSGNSTGGGFWSGAATGGLLGYLFGNRRSSSYYHHQPYSRPHTGWGSGWGSSWGSGWGSSSSGWGSSGSSSSWGSGGGGGSSSSGTRTASGFGGTRRR